jgi:hypothetical protein
MPIITARERAHHMDLIYLERGNAHFDLSTGQHLVNLPPENIPKALKVPNLLPSKKKVLTLI